MIGQLRGVVLSSRNQHAKVALWFVEIRLIQSNHLYRSVLIEYSKFDSMSFLIIFLPWDSNWCLQSSACSIMELTISQTPWKFTLCFIFCQTWRHWSQIRWNHFNAISYWISPVKSPTQGVACWNCKGIKKVLIISFSAVITNHYQRTLHVLEVFAFWK